MTTTIAVAQTAAPELSARLYAMRGGYLLTGLGLAQVKWPSLPDALVEPPPGSPRPVP
jgi:hypothetical protein